MQAAIIVTLFFQGLTPFSPGKIRSDSTLTILATHGVSAIAETFAGATLSFVFSPSKKETKNKTRISSLLDSRGAALVL
nr:hypothetical protein [Erwinia rhapontici]